MTKLGFATVSAIALWSSSAQAAISFTGSFAVAGAATDLSGFGPAEGANRLSFGSDLVYDRATDLYYGITDRGPGGGLISFAPRVNVFKLDVNATTNSINGSCMMP